MSPGECHCALPPDPVQRTGCPSPSKTCTEPLATHRRESQPCRRTNSICFCLLIPQEDSVGPPKWALRKEALPEGSAERDQRGLPPQRASVLKGHTWEDGPFWAFSMKTAASFLTALAGMGPIPSSARPSLPSSHFSLLCPQRK